MTNDEMTSAVISRALSEETDAFVPVAGWARSLDELLQRAASGRPAPLTTVVRRTRWASVVAVAAVAAAVVVTVALLPSPPAEAWSATPALAEGTARAALVADCQDMSDVSVPAVLVEQRGSSSLTILADSSQCLIVTGLGGAGPFKTGGRDVVPANESAAGQVQVIHDAALNGVGIMDPATDEAELTAGYMAVVGRAGTEVEKVVIHTIDRGDVAASLEGGWFAAWWPSLTEPVSLTVTTRTGSYDLDL